MRRELLASSERDTHRIGAALGRELTRGDVVALIGALGAGKTRLAGGIAAGLAVAASEIINSPTFVLAREYQGRVPLFHLDAYRLGSFSELLDLGWDEMRERGVVVVEWANRFDEVTASASYVVEARHIGETARAFSVVAADPGRMPRFPADLEASDVATQAPRGE